MKTLLRTIFVIVLGASLVWGIKRFKAYSAPEPTATTTATTSTIAVVRTDTSVRNATSTDYTPTDETSSTASSTWKTYSSIGSIVTLKYPSDWSLSGTTLTSPKGDMTIDASYAQGTLPACDPAVCAQVAINGRTFNRILESSNNGVTLTYMTSVSGYVVSAVVSLPNNAAQTANIALADEIIGTVKVK